FYPCNVRGIQAELWGSFAVGFVVERHWFESEDGFACFVHRFNLFLKPLRGASRAQLTRRVYHHCYRVRIYCRNVTDAGDKGRGLCSIRADADRADFGSNTFVADINIIIARGERVTSCKAQCNVVEAGGVATERFSTDGRVDAAGCVCNECEPTDSRVVAPHSVKDKRIGSNGSIL